MNNSTKEWTYPVPAYIACGLNSPKELSKLSLQEIFVRLQQFYEDKIVIFD